jgi:hypothetical protein
VRERGEEEENGCVWERGNSGVCEGEREEEREGIGVYVRERERRRERE